MQEKHVPQRNK